MTETRTPKFCNTCGSRLVPSDNIDGYDVYTGEPLLEQRLRCENPTVTVTGNRLNQKKSITRHATWVNENGTWQAQ